MKHSLNAENLGEFGLPIVDAIQKCVHCGFCLPTCPTYQVQGQEMDSPRGRIVLMKEVLEGNLDPDQAALFVDRCLGCVACETACPSGVPYGNLLSSFRSLVHDRVAKSWGDRIREFLVHNTVPYPARFRLAARLGRLTRPFAFLMPHFLKPMLELIPGKMPRTQTLPEFSAAIGERMGRVGLLAGCAQQVLAPEINLATIRVLNRAGFDVVVPRGQSCCGALDWHEGRIDSTRKLAAGNFNRFPDDLDAIVTNAAGCGSAIGEYGVIFRGAKHFEAAQRFAERVVDISVFLAEQNLPSGKLAAPTRVAYQDACHLAHAQGIVNEPRKLLEQIGNVELVPIQESDRCCGSAGTYNLSQPEIAERLGEWKAQSIVDSGCDFVASGNIGCLVQIRKHLELMGSQVRALHLIEILDLAYSDNSPE